jgi:hypothetical protein
VWKSVRGFAGLYSISNLGRVWSHRQSKVMAPRADRDGYLLISFRDHNTPPKVTTHKVHRLVAKAFIPNPKRLPEVDHKFQRVADNRASQLRWATVAFNRQCRVRTHARSGIIGVRHRPEKKNPWQAYCQPSNRFKSLGHFPDRESAVKARKTYEGGRNG